jgi:hypothetical protein
MKPPFWYLTILTGALPSSLVPGTGSAKVRVNASSAGGESRLDQWGRFGDETVTALVNPLPAWPLPATSSHP